MFGGDVLSKVFPRLYVQLSLFRFNVRILHESRKFMRAHFPNDDSARAAAIQFEKCCSSLLDTFENMKGKAALYKQNRAWEGKRMCVFYMYIYIYYILYMYIYIYIIFHLTSMLKFLYVGHKLVFCLCLYT